MHLPPFCSHRCSIANPPHCCTFCSTSTTTTGIMELVNASANSVNDAPAKGANDGTGTHVTAMCAAIELTRFPKGIVQLDPYLEPFSGALKSRYAKAQQWIKTINDTEGGLEKFSRVSTTQCTLSTSS